MVSFRFSSAAQPPPPPAGMRFSCGGCWVGWSLSALSFAVFRHSNHISEFGFVVLFVLCFSVWLFESVWKGNERAKGNGEEKRSDRLVLRFSFLLSVVQLFPFALPLSLDLVHLSPGLIFFLVFSIHFSSLCFGLSKSFAFLLIVLAHFRCEFVFAFLASFALFAFDLAAASAVPPVGGKFCFASW